MSFASQFRDPRIVGRACLALAGFCGLVGLIVEYGTEVSPTDRRVVQGFSAAAVLLFFVEQGLALATVRPLRRLLRQRWPTLLLTTLLLVQLAVLVFFGRGSRVTGVLERLSLGSVTRAYLILAQFYILALLAVNLPRLHSRFAAVRIRPALAFGLVFATIILGGAGLLMLSQATPPDAPISPLDALFTATSAVCVTGLIVRDTAVEFTRMGQTVILILIQLGGLGIMSLTAFLSLLLGRGIGIRESNLLREVLQVPLWSEVGGLLRFIVVMTLAVEASGAALLYVGLGAVIPDPGARLYSAVFHAVSAFCNAGFSTFSASLVPLADNALVTGTVAGLLVAGGLGFTVIAQLVVLVRHRLRGQRRARRLDLQARLVLGLSLVLLVGGTLALLLLEGRGALAGLPLGQRVSLAFFQSATCRTAGFNTLDLTALGAPALLLMTALMFIGGGSGSTAGGIKLTTLAVVWANFGALRLGFEHARLGDREIDATAINRALVVVSAAAAAAAAGVFVLMLSEGRDLLTTLFEVVSALGTVGLTLGLTPELSAVGRWAIIVLMFVGRLGPLTLAYGLTPASREHHARLPRANLMIG